jgi:hypothetical protein
MYAVIRVAMNPFSTSLMLPVNVMGFANVAGTHQFINDTLVCT